MTSGRRPANGPKRWRPPTAVAVVVAVVLLSSGVAWASFSAQNINGSNSYSSGTLQLDGTTPGPASCYTTGTGSGGSVVAANTTSCSGNPLPTTQLSSSSVTSTSTTLSSVGTLTGTTGTLSSSTCGEEAVNDSSSAASDTGLVYGGISYGTSFVSPNKSTFTSTGITLDGSTGYVGSISQLTGPNTFSLVAWVKTSTTTGGGIMGFANTQSNSGASNYDRLLWVDNSGFVVFGVYPGAVQEVTSTTKVNNGAWHLVVATLSSSGMALYIDNKTAITSTSATSAQSYSGWWHLGWSPHSGWTDTPTSDYLSGSLAEVAVVPSALSSTNVSTLYASTSASGYASSVAGFSPTAFWTLSDTGTTPYTGSVPALASTTTLADASVNSNTGTIQGGVTAGASGPLNDTGISLNGASGSYVETTTQYTDPTPLTQVIWFKAPTSGAAGSLMGWTNVQTNSTPANWDRQIWIDQTGHIVYGVYNGAVQEVTSPSTYTDGNWHMVVASVGSAGLQLWIDGTEVASNASVTSPENSSGWWHLGFSYAASGWTNGPSSDYWNGSLAQAAIIPTQLSSAQIATLHAATTSGIFEADVLALSPTAYWPLDDGSSVCNGVLMDVQATLGSTTTCLYPAGSGSCATTPPTTSYLSALSSRSMPVPTSSSTLTLLVRTELSSASPAGVLGLHVLINLSLAVTRSSWSATLSYSKANAEV